MRSIAILCFSAAAASAAPSPRAVALAGVSREPAVPTEVAAAIEAGFDAELRTFADVAVVSAAEVAGILGAERMRQLLGAEGSPAAGALLVGLEGREVVTVAVGARGRAYLIRARRLTPDGRTARTQDLEVGADAGQLAQAAVPMLAALFPELKKRGAPAASATTVKPIRVAVLEVRSAGEVPARALAALNQSVTPELRKLEGVSAIASSELSDMLGIERQKQLMGCSDDSGTCLEELAGALDADEMVTLDLTLVGETYALAARRSDLKKSKVLQAQLKQFDKRDGEELLAVIGPTVAALYPDRSLKAGRSRGVESAVIRRLNPPPLPRWVFVSTAGLAAAAGFVGGTFGWLSFEAQRDFHTLAQRSLIEPVGGTDLAALRAKSYSSASTANAFFAAAAGLAVVAIIEIFFTDWKDDRAAFVDAVR